MQEAYHHIDYDIPIRIIKSARAAGIRHCSLVTSCHSNTNSIFRYFRTKGELENSVMELDFAYTSIFRPGLLNRGDMATLMEKIARKNDT